MRKFNITIPITLFLASLLSVAASGPVGVELAPNGGFERGFEGWTRWGKDANLIRCESLAPHSGTNCARIEPGQAALYFNAPVTPGQALELRFFYRLGGGDSSGEIELGFFRKGGRLHSAGLEKCHLTNAPALSGQCWIEFRKIFLPASTAVSCQFTFTTAEGSTLWLDDVSLKTVPCPPGLSALPDPWDGLKRRTAKPLFRELLAKEPGCYTAVCWAHDLNPKDGGKFKSEELKDPAIWQKKALEIMEKTAQAGLGFMDLPIRPNEKEPWRAMEFHRRQFRDYGVRYDAWTEGSPSIIAGIKNGAEILNPAAHKKRSRPILSWVDPKYVEAQADLLAALGRSLRGEPCVGYYYGKDESFIQIPEGDPNHWGAYGKTMAREVREQYGFGRFEVPQSGETFLRKDPSAPLRWIAYNRWANERFIDSRCQLRQALRQADPNARYSPADYWFMSGFVPYDYSRLAACSDLMELDPYASSAEKTRGRGVFNHGFGAKFMSDQAGKPVRIVAQAFDYAGYDMAPDDLREWVSQAMRCGASAINYYENDSPRWTHYDRWQMMLRISGVITRMNRLKLPEKADTAVLYALYTHMSHGPSTSGDQVYAAHALVGELAGSWYRFVSDAQIERGDKSLAGYKVIYLPLAKYMTTEAADRIEEYVRQGGILVCGDAEAFAFDLAGNDTSALAQRILGIRSLGHKKADEITLSPSRTASHGALRLKMPAKGAALPLFPIKLYGEESLGRARQIEIVDSKAEILGTYPDGSPAIVLRPLGKGWVMVFAANPFSPQGVVDGSPWPEFFKSMQKSFGCKTEQPIWRFALPAS